MNHKDLPERWKFKVIEFLRSKCEENRTELNAYDFKNQIVKIKFEDDSFAEFKYSIVIHLTELNETGVFTEHCGYHIFNLGEGSIDIIG